MQFAAIGNWILMFLGQAWFFLIAYGQFEIFPAIFIVTIIIDIYLHLCEVRAAAFMKNKGVHWRNSCSGNFSDQKQSYRVFKKYFFENFEQDSSAVSTTKSTLKRLCRLMILVSKRLLRNEIKEEYSLSRQLIHNFWKINLLLYFEKL